MRALIFDSGLRLDVNVPVAQLQDGQALLKIRKAGICNTDLELIRGYKGFSGILGHEFVAEVAEGPDHLIGKRVVGEINVACGKCDFCQRGIPSQCRARAAVGIFKHPGAFADYLPLTIHNLHIVPDQISDDAAVFVEPLAAALNVLEMVHISPRDHVIVLGVGKLGMLVTQVLKLVGARVTGIVRREKQAKLLAQWGILSAYYEDLPTQQAQVVVDCTGLADGFDNALNLVEPRGTVVLKSTYEGLPQADLTRVAVNELRIVGSRCGPFDAALRLMAAGVIDFASLIEAHYSLDDAVSAMEHAAQKGVLKVLLDM